MAAAVSVTSMRTADSPQGRRRGPARSPRVGPLAAESGVAAAALSASGPEGTNGHPGLLQSGADGPGDGDRTGGVPVDAH